jgi:hypothetical protein
MGSLKMTDPTFVRACSADLERVLSFVKTYYEFDAIPFSATEVRSGLEALLRDLSLGQIWLIRVGHEDVGYVVLSRSNESNHSSWHQCFRFRAQVDNAPKSTVHTIAQNRLPPVKLDHTYRNI